MKEMRFPILLSAFFILSMFVTSSSSGAELKKLEKTYPIQTATPFLVSLDVDAGEVYVHKNNQPDQATISVRYDEESDEIDLDYDDHKNELSISIDRNKWFKSCDDHRAPRLELLLPQEAIIELTCKIKAGEIEFSLDSLKVKDFELQNFAGEVKVDFPQPNRIDMRMLDINVKIGETKLRRLGNARFQKARINGGIGEMEIDFSGEGLKLSRVDIDLDIGETMIYLPRELGVRFDSSTLGFLTQSQLDFKFDKKGRFYLSDNYDSAAKKLDMSISSGIGELRVLYR